MAKTKVSSGERSTASTRHRREAPTTMTTALVTGASALGGRPAKVEPLLRGYGEALARSLEVGHSVSFRVDVDPDGDATITPVDDRVAEDEAFAPEEIGKPSPELQRALAAARERGRIRAAEVLGGEDMLGADDFAKMLGTTRMTVNAKRQKGQVLGLDGAKRGFRFPVWQLDRDGKPYGELMVLNERLGGPWAVYRFLVQPHGELDGLTGREALERGETKTALAAAESIGRGDFR